MLGLHISSILKKKKVGILSLDTFDAGRKICEGILQNSSTRGLIGVEKNFKKCKKQRKENKQTKNSTP